MADCLDKRFADLLHAYELGMLSDTDRAEFEIHLTECDACFEKVRRLSESARLMRHDPDIRQDIRQIDGAHTGQMVPDAKLIEAPPSRGRRLRPALWPTLAVAAAVLLVFLLKPWDVEFHPTKEAIAVENRLVVLYFDNMSDPQDTLRLGEMVASLLISDLSESHYVQVVSGQRLYDILKLLGQEDIRTLDREVATKVAQEARARWMLTGSIIPTDSQTVLTTQLIDVATGDIVAAQRISGTADESVFSLVDRLTAATKKDLTLPAAAQQEPDRSVAEVTTHSAEAYRYYLAGVDYFNKYYWRESRRSFAQALEFDSTFAMVYYYLSQLIDPDLINKAVEYSADAGQREKFYIQSQAAAAAGDTNQAIAKLQQAVERYPDEKTAHYLMGQYYFYLIQHDKAIDHLEKAIKIDPLYKGPYNQLAYVYDETGDYEKAIVVMNKYISLVPDEANPYDTQGDIYASNGKLDEAILSYQQALKIKPDYYSSLVKLGNMYLFSYEYARVESCYQVLTISESRSWRSEGRHRLALIPLHQGKFNEAITVVDEAIAADRDELPGGESALSHRLMAYIHQGRDSLALALEEMEKCIDISQRSSPGDKTSLRNLLVQILAENGDFTRAEQETQELKEQLEESGSWLLAYWYAAGCLEFARGDYEAAITHLEEFVTVGWRMPCFVAHYMLGRAYLESGRLAEAVEEFEQQLAIYDYWRLYWGSWNVKMHYYLGRAYEESRWHGKAIEQYQIFLDIWKNADPGIEAVEDAKTRLARLKITS